MSADLEAKIRRVTEHLAQGHARRLLREMRREARAKTRARRQETRRRQMLGQAVLAAGLVDWESAEILGLLLTGRDRAASSPDVRATLRARGEAELSRGAVLKSGQPSASVTTQLGG